MDDTPTLGKIEVTPEMIEAGVRELSSWDENFDSKEVAVRWIFEAMEGVYREAKSPNKKVATTASCPKAS